LSFAKTWLFLSTYIFRLSTFVEKSGGCSSIVLISNIRHCHTQTNLKQAALSYWQSYTSYQENFSTMLSCTNNYYSNKTEPI